MADSLWEADRCSKCNSEKSVARIQLLYSVCCGYVLCKDCLTDVFRTHRSWPCPDCEVMLGKADFNRMTFGQQLLQKGKKARASTGFIFELQREDFQDDKEWNDHLEFIEDIIYRSVRGDAAEAAEGQKLMAEYRDRKQSLLYKVLSRKNQANTAHLESFKSTKDGVGESDRTINLSTSTMNAPPPMMTLPQPKGSPKQSPVKDPTTMTPTSRKRYNLRQKVKNQMSRQAGGFQLSFDSMRTEQSISSSLFLF